MSISHTLQNHVASSTTLAASTATVTLAHFHASDIAVYISMFGTVIGLFLQGVYVWSVWKNTKSISLEVKS